MNSRKGLVLDANILIRAVLGQRVRQILEEQEAYDATAIAEAIDHRLKIEPAL